MATIIFYGKPNCINNSKQKSLLRAAGHVVDDQDILNQKWQPDQLCSYFGNAPVPEWFNMTAPAIKVGAVEVDTMSAQDALEAMMADPLLIRRPLMNIEGQKVCGFRHEQLDEMIGLSPMEGYEKEMAILRSENITLCPFSDKFAVNCDEKEIS